MNPQTIWSELADLHRTRFSCSYDGQHAESHSCRPTFASPRPRVVPYWMQEDDKEGRGDGRDDDERDGEMGS